MKARRAVLAALLLAAALATAAPAEHAVAYRYTVLGYVTDADGFYVIVARLGDESAGETLSLRAGSQALVLTARFDPADHTTERGTRVDFTARRPVESPTLFDGTLKRFLAQ